MESLRLCENLKDQRILPKNSKLSVRPCKTLSITVSYGSLKRSAIQC